MKARFRQLIARIFENQAKRLIKRHRLVVVAVAGSVGKTTTKLAIATVLSEKFKTLVREGNYNTEIGLPLSVFQMDVPAVLLNPFAWIWRLIQTEVQIRSDYSYKVLVLELGTDTPGEMPMYLKYLNPDIGVMTAVTPEHMENFPGGLDEVAAEELCLAAASKQFLAARDDIPAKYRHKYIDHHPGHAYYGIEDGADYRIKIASSNPLSGTAGEILKGGHVAVKHAQLNVFGAHSAKTALAAYAVGDLLGLTKAELEAGIEKIHPVSGRMNAIRGVNGSVIIDDTYNSSPEAVQAGLDALEETPAIRRIALLGSMNELGQDSPKYHEEAGTAAAGLDILVTVGDLANRYLGPAAVRAGLDPTRVVAAPSPRAAGEHLKLILRPGDVLLAKGSQNGVFAEEAVKQLLADPSDKSKLVRQSAPWLKTKIKQFPDNAA